MANSVRVVDRGADALMKRLADMDMAVKVGVIGSEAAAPHKLTGTTVVDIATIQEFGLGSPQRSFIRGYVDENEPKLRARLRGVGEQVLKGQLSLRAGLDRYGLLTVGEIQERMSRGIPPGLSESTKKRRGENAVALIASGQLRSSITHAVTQGGPV